MFLAITFSQAKSLLKFTPEVLKLLKNCSHSIAEGKTLCTLFLVKTISHGKIITKFSNRILYTSGSQTFEKKNCERLIVEGKTLCTLKKK